MRKLANSVILLIVAVTLFAIFVPISLIYAIMLAPWSTDYLARIIARVGVSIDQLGNVICAGFFNRLFVKGCKPFGLEDDTISEVMARNSDHLTDAGKMIARILNRIDPGHLEKSIIENENY